MSEKLSTCGQFVHSKLFVPRISKRFCHEQTKMLQWNVVILFLQYLEQQNVMLVVRFCYKRSSSLLYLHFQEVNSQ